MVYEKKSKLESEVTESDYKSLIEEVEKKADEFENPKEMYKKKKRFSFAYIFIFVSVPIILFEIFILFFYKGTHKEQFSNQIEKVALLQMDSLNPYQELILFNRLILDYGKNKKVFPENLEEVSKSYNVSKPRYLYYTKDENFGFILKINDDSIKSPTFSAKGIIVQK
ncbi:MAG: hypothetical protein ABIN35_04325 [candidate division WOR-3 bacterium]